LGLIDYHAGDELQVHSSGSRRWTGRSAIPEFCDELRRFAADRLVGKRTFRTSGHDIVYGTVVTDEMATASGKVARLVVNGTGSGTEPISSH
jgi:hypothetical protein